MKSLLIISFFALLSINSCTVQKRVHLSGYNVQWHQKASNQKRLAFNKKRAFSEKKNESKITVQPEKVENEKTSRYDSQVASKTDSYSSSSKCKNQISLAKEMPGHTKQFNHTYESANTVKAKRNNAHHISLSKAKDGNTNKLALWSFISALLFWLWIPVISAWLLGMLALKQFEKGRGGSDGKWMAMTGFIVGVIGFFASSVVFLAAAVFAGPIFLIPAFIFLALAVVSLIYVF